MIYFPTRQEANALARLLKKAGYAVSDIQTHKATGYGIYRTKAGASFNTDAPGGAVEVASAILGQGRYSHTPRERAEADLEWMSKQYPEDYARVVKAFGKVAGVDKQNPGGQSGQGGQSGKTRNPGDLDAGVVERLRAKVARYEGSHSEDRQAERKYALAMLKFYDANGRFPGEVDYTLSPVGRNPAGPPKDPRQMTPGEINRELDKLSAEDSRINDQLIAAGRGHERLSEILATAGTDPLAARLRANIQRHIQLTSEIERQYGPGAPTRFPHGWRGMKRRTNPEYRYGVVLDAYGKTKLLQPSGEQPIRDTAYNLAMDNYRHGRGPIRYWELSSFNEAMEFSKRAVKKREQTKLPPPTFTITNDDLYNFKQAYLAPEDEGGEWERNMARVIDQILARRNPAARSNPADSADRLYEQFHGRPPEETVIVETPVHEHTHLAELGDLTNLKVRTISGLDAEIDFLGQGVLLCSSEDGRQLYFQGGNQELDLGALEMSGDDWKRDLMVIGDLSETTYNTQKEFDQFQSIDYYHANGEDTGVPPELLYDPISKLLSVAGGQYKVKPEGIVN